MWLPTFLTKFSKLSHNCCWHNARHMCYTCCGVVCAAYMRAVLWSAVLYVVLHAAQPLQPLHLGKSIAILTRSSFLASTTKRQSQYLILYYHAFFLPSLALGIILTLVVLLWGCQVTPISTLLYCTSKLHKSSYWAHQSNINATHLYFFYSGWPRDSKSC